MDRNENIETTLLKFITCGSVDDGKSTLIGHMLYDAKLIYADQKQALELESKVGSREGDIDYSLLLDGLMAEREQGITIDVAYRYFSTDKRSFIVADTPGHEEYTRNMAVGASFADLAVVLTDASQGILVQTRRHTRICSLMGIRHFVFVVNKMDLMHYDKYVFERINREILKMVAEYEPASVCVIPASATEGDNITSKSANMPWYEGKPLLQYLEEVNVENSQNGNAFYMPVQRVSRPNYTFRGFQGQIEAGSVSVGDEISVLPSGEKATVSELYITDKKAVSASRGQAVTVLLDKEIDVSRGCVLQKDSMLYVGSMFKATMLWMDDQPLVAGKNYLIKIGTKCIAAMVMRIKYKIDVNGGERIPADKIYKNEIAVCDISVSDKVVFDVFEREKNMPDRTLGAFILIDRVTDMTSACGIVNHELRRGNNLHEQDMDIDRKIRSEQKNQNPLTLWFTGLSGSGKSTLANEMEKKLVSMGLHTMSLDGDNVRMGLNKNLGFKEADRIENIRRIAEVSKLMNDAGLIVLTSFISPFEGDRRNAKEIIGDSFVEIYVSTPIEVCEARDVKGLYKKARKGEVPNFTGISSPYEAPSNPDVVVDTSAYTIDECVEKIMEAIKDKIRHE